MNVRRVATAALGLVICGWLAAAAWIDRVGTASFVAAPGCVIVVLGARVDSGGVPSPTLAARVAEGVRAARERPDATLLFSGGIGTNPPAEANVGRALALDAGIVESRVLVELNSHSTLENARESAALISGRCVELVSDPYHLARARYAFEREGLVVFPRPVLDAPRHRDVVDRVTWTLREVPAFVRLALTR